MKKICAFFALFCALFFFAACKGGQEEGIYLGIIGFNDAQYIKDIDFLDDSSESDFTSFIDDLTYSDGTSLYFADYTALNKMRSHSLPPKLKKVALVTFTDGLDNMSLAKNETNPENYNSQSAYRDAIHDMIVNEKIHEYKVDAYSIGLVGKDVEDQHEQAQFKETLKKLASSESNVFLVSNMDEVMKHFNEIAKGIYSISTTVNLDVKLPGGYDDGQLLRFTFDYPPTAQDSNLYIEATFHRSKDQRTLEKIKAKGLKGEQGIPTNSVEGGFYHFVFKNLKYGDSDSPISESDISRIELWKQTSTGGWDRESEFNPESSSTVTEDKNSALIMLVLDCTTSLGSDFSEMKQNAKNFVTTLVYDSSNRNNSEESSNGDNIICASNLDCNRDSYCYLDNHFCQKRPLCSTQAECPTGWECKESEGFCITNEEAGGTILCESNNDCKDPAFPKCNLATYECVANNSDFSDSCPTVDGNMWSSQSSSKMNWNDAIDYCNNLNECGHTDWRLPSISELRTLIKLCPATQMPPVGSDVCAVRSDEDYFCLSKSCWTESACYSCPYYGYGGHSKFSNSTWFWSSSLRSDGQNGVWLVDFGYGGVFSNGIDGNNDVRCVR